MQIWFVDTSPCSFSLSPSSFVRLFARPSVVLIGNCCSRHSHISTMCVWSKDAYAQQSVCVCVFVVSIVWLSLATTVTAHCALYLKKAMMIRYHRSIVIQSLQLVVYAAEGWQEREREMQFEIYRYQYCGRNLLSIVSTSTINNNADTIHLFVVQIVCCNNGQCLQIVVCVLDRKCDSLQFASLIPFYVDLRL